MFEIGEKVRVYGAVKQTGQRGNVVEVLKNSFYRVVLDNGDEVVYYRDNLRDAYNA